MTPQQHANELLAAWQAQRQAKIPVEERRLPDHDCPMNDDFPTEPIKYAVNPIPLLICLSLALWGAIEAVVMFAVRMW